MNHGYAHVDRTDADRLRLLTPPESTIALSAYEREQSQRGEWPYRWVYPPPNSTRRMPQGSVAIPAVGSTSVILAFQVQTNFDFIWTEVLIPPPAGGFVPGSGDLTWTLDVDTPVATPPLTASPFADFQAMSIPLGSVSPFVPCRLSRAEVIKSGQTLRAKITNVNLGGGGVACAMFMGWLVPAIGR
jgi:hypothetical protein